MLPLLLDLGAVGSPVDVATFVLVLGLIGYEVRPRQATLAAAVVALARQVRPVDHEHLQAELDVPDREIEQLEPTVIAADGGRDDG